jgi:hypothetical protein
VLREGKEGRFAPNGSDAAANDGRYRKEAAMQRLGAFFAGIVLAAGSAIAAPQLTSGPYTVSDALDAFYCGDPYAIFWEQPPDGASGLSAQDDACYPFQSECADDFVGNGNPIDAVGWYGVYWNGSPIAPDAFNIRFYSDAAGFPGAELGITTSSDYNETVGDPYGYCTEVDWLWTNYGIKYHISIQAVLCFPPQWGIGTGVGNGTQGSFKSALFGFPDWVTNSTIFGVPYELAFLVYEGYGTSPAKETSWSAIKDLYR